MTADPYPPRQPADPAMRAALFAYLRTLEARAQPAGYRAPLMVTVNTVRLGMPR